MVIFDGFQLLDLAGPMAVFEGAVASGFPYKLVTLSTDGGLVGSSNGMPISTQGLRDTNRLDTVIVCGGIGAVDGQTDDRLANMLQARARPAVRLASVCTGAFILGRAGLLDGRTATTHWRFAAELSLRHPDANIEPDRIWVRDGQIWTSAGMTAGIDLSLAIVETDYGQAVAKAIARELVVYHRRPGGQSQHSALLDIESSTNRFSHLLGWARENIGQVLTVDRLAGQAGMSARNFMRSFARETGTTPARAIERMRLEVARERVENASDPFGKIAVHAGFRSADRMRLAFIRAYGLPPQAFRRKTR